MKVGVVMGGISSEREISIATGNEILDNLDKKKYEAIPIVLNKKSEIISYVREVDVVFLALHGQYGEDGTIQGTLDTLGIPYTGCGMLSSALCMNKEISKSILSSHGINTPEGITVKSLKGMDYGSLEGLGYPLVVKPNSGGSSVGTYIAANRDELTEAVSRAVQYDKEVIVEQYVKGDEITCCILDGEMLPVIAIKPGAAFFDYTSKYSDGGADETIAYLEDKIQEIVKETALRCYKLLQCSVYARVDIILRNGTAYVLEVNTLPGMTRNSLFPKSAKAAGIDFSGLLDRIIVLSLCERDQAGV